MHSFVRSGLLAATSLTLTGALFVSPAHAVETGGDVTSAAEAPEPDKPTSVGTGATDESSEITVTARRRVESAQKVPLAISVVGGDHIDATGAFNVGRLQALTPSLQFSSSNPRNTSLNIRGIGAPFGLTNDGIEQGVGIYVDDVYYSRAASSTFDFLDVARIEVLRGPQGTLYGKNTTAGAIAITTRAPTFDFEGRAEVSVGNLDFKQAKAAISGPITDNLAARFAVSLTSRRGTLYNVSTSRWINEQDNLGMRLQLLWKPAAGIEVTLAGDYSAQNPECCGTVYIGAGATQRALNRQYAALTAALGYAVPSTNPYDRRTDLDAELNAGNKIGGTSLRVKADLGKGTLTSVTAWRFWDWKPANDRDFLGLPITTKSQNPSQQNQYTQEFRYNYESDKIDFVVGLFGYKQTVRTQGLQVQGSAASRFLLSGALASNPAVLNNLTASNQISLDNTSAALFGQLTWKPTDKLRIQPGIRVNYDSKDGSYSSVVTGTASDGTRQLVLFTGPYSTDPWIVAQRGVLPPQAFTAKYKAWNFSFDLTTSYQVTSDVQVYATYARTFKSGGINLNGIPADNNGVPILSAATVKPERVNHFELGLKSQFWDRKATFNLAAFRTDIGNFQALVQNGQLGVLRGYLASAEKVRTQGIEIDFSVRPSGRFNFYINGAFTDARYKKFVDAPCPPELSGGTASPANCDISGQRLPGISKWSFSYGAEYNIPAKLLGNDGQAYLGVDGNTRSNFSSNPTPSAYTWVDGYTVTNFRLGYRSDSGIDVFGWVRNAFDTHYIEMLQVASGNTGLIVGNPGDPRTWGVTIKAKF